MNRYKFIFKFITNRPDVGKYNWNLLFPFAGVILGCMIVALTLSIMEGMEHSIFTKLKQISFPGKIENISSVVANDLENFLENNGLLYQKGIEDQIIIMNGSNFRLATIHGIEKFQEFRENVFDLDVHELSNKSNLSRAYIGRSLSIKLDITIGDTVMIVHPKNINIFTGLPNRKQMIIYGIFEMKILDYDQQHIFCQYNEINDFLPKSRNNLYLDRSLDNEQSFLFQQKFPELQYKFWEEKHQSFISAMKLEKFTYSIIGFLIVCIAGFTLMSMMSLSVMQKVPQIGILRAIGMGKSDIGYIFIFQAIITSIISSIVGILLSLFVIYLDKHYYLIHVIFPDALFFNFYLILKTQYIVIIFITSLILMIISGLYPAIKAAHLDPVQSIGFKR